MFILALLPIPYLYLINLVVTIIMPGILLGFLLSFDLHKGLIGSMAFIHTIHLKSWAFAF